MAIGRLEEGLEVCKRAVALDPVGVILTACLGWHCLFSRQPQKAMEPSFKALRMDPNLFWAHLILGWAYEQQGQFEEAVAEYQNSVSLSAGAVITVAALGHVYARSGRRQQAEEVLADLTARRTQCYVSSYDVATVYAGLGDREETFAALDKAC